MTMVWIDMLQWFGCATGVAGSALLALNRPRISGYGFVAYLLSNVCWIVYAASVGAHGLFVQQAVFTATSLVGVWRWLIAPRRRVGQALTASLRVS